MFDLCGPMKGCATPHERVVFMEGDLKLKWFAHEKNATEKKVYIFILHFFVCKYIGLIGFFLIIRNHTID